MRALQRGFRSRTGIRVGWILLALWVGLYGVRPGVPAQTGETRRRSAAEPIQLKGGSRVEFKSFQSASLGHEQPYSIFLPPSYDTNKNARYPVVYFLHGLNNDHTSWTVDLYGRLQEKLEDLIKSGTIPEILMVHPKGDNGFYTNAVGGTRLYEDFIIKDVLQHVEATYRVKPGREYRSIGGTSMGGYGALKLGMKHPDLFAAAVGHSPIVFPQENPFDASDRMKDSRFYQYFKGLFTSIYGDPINRAHWEANNLLWLADKRSDTFRPLKIYFDYGTADRYNRTIQLDVGCQKLHRILEAHKMAHIFKEHAGDPHGWELVNKHFGESIPFLCQTFKK